MTVADLKVQKTIEVCLAAIYPNLQVMGEESQESIADVEPAIQPNAFDGAIRSFIKTDFLTQSYEGRRDWIESQLRQHYDLRDIAEDKFATFSTKDACVWIDPLDGTSDFVKGNLPAVTVLIGLSICNRSRLGIVHKPFIRDNEELGKTVFGSAEHGVFSVDYDRRQTIDEQLSREINYLEPFNMEEPAEDHQIRVAASLSHFSDTIKEVLGGLDPVEIKRIGGAGNKVLNLATGEVDCYIHPSPGLMHWDLCAPESLVKGMGGWATNLYQERLRYPIDAPNYKLKGLICANTPPMYGLIKRRMGSVLVNIASKVKL